MYASSIAKICFGNLFFKESYSFFPKDLHVTVCHRYINTIFNMKRHYFAIM